jgi:hypothetical protein
VSDPVVEALRYAVTLDRHTMVAGKRCCYCGAEVRPRYDRRTGYTHGLDHFIPVMILAEFRRWYPHEASINWLVRLRIKPTSEALRGRYAARWSPGRSIARAIPPLCAGRPLVLFCR